MEKIRRRTKFANHNSAFFSVCIEISASGKLQTRFSLRVLVPSRYFLWISYCFPIFITCITYILEHIRKFFLYGRKRSGFNHSNVSGKTYNFNLSMMKPIKQYRDKTCIRFQKCEYPFEILFYWSFLEIRLNIVSWKILFFTSFEILYFFETEVIVYSI